jgi:type II secretion system protein D
MTPSWLAQPGQPTKNVEGAAPPAAPQVKLNYTAATWEKVLKDLAEQTGSQLIADRVPAGRYSRRDKTLYSRGDAVRIINREIEPLGFRVIEKGQYLIVLDLPSQRPRYQPPTVPKPTHHTATTPPENPPPTHVPQRQFSQVTPVPQPSAPAPQASAAERKSPRGGAGGPAGTGIRQASHEQPHDPPAGRRHVLEAEGDDAADGESSASTVVVFRARYQKATELAKRVYRLFRDRAELVDVGRNGLPAFRVRKIGGAAAAAPVLFTVSIDAEKEELLIDARAAEADALLKLLRRLDTLEEEPIQLVSSTKSVCTVAPQLPAEFARLRAQRERQEGLTVAQAGQPRGGDPSPMATGQQLPAEGPPARGPLEEVVGNVKAEVAIEAIPDLGVIIIKGNEADVAQVMKVIRELERLSENTAPTVHLLFLKHVNSEALAELLTTVYESLAKFPGKATQPRQNVAILPVSKPNAILIVAPASDMESILDLADQLDMPVDPLTEFEVFPLKAAIASRVVEKLEALYQEPVGLGARIIIQADERSNSVIVRAKPSDLDEIAALIKKIDREQTDTVSQVKVFTLKNAVATEMAAILNTAIQSVLSPPQNQGASQVFGTQGFGAAGGQVAEEFRDVPSTVLEILAPGAEGQKRLRSGILANIRITPNPQANSLIVSAPEASLALIEQLIKALDQPTGLVAEIKVFTLANADATVIVQQLQGLFNAQVTGGAGQAGVQRQQQLGIQVAGAEDASSGLIPLRFSVDTRTNSVIAIGAADSLRVVEALMLRLDESDIRDRKQSVYRLKNSPATNIANSVTQFLTSQQQLAQQDPNLFSTVEQLEREVIVVAEPVSNSLLISATPRYYDEILNLIKKLDEQPQQVIMQALIVEVELEDTDEFGVEMGFQDSILFDRSLVDSANTYTTTTTTTQNNTTVTQTNIISQAATPGFLFNNPSVPLGNNVSGTNTNAVGTQGLSNFSLGRVNGDLGFGGLVLSASSESVSLLLRALAQNRQVRVLSRPQVRAMDNQVALIQQGQNVPIVNGVQITANGLANPSVVRDDAGVILEVTPRISPDGNIVMAIRAEKSQYNLSPGSGVPIFVDANTGNVIESPVKDISIAQTTISVPNGQTVVLGGLITTRTDNIHRRVPWLGDIPVVGWAFRYDFVKTRRTELLIFLTPRIITDEAYSEHIKEVEMARIHFIECEAEELHGPLRGIPSEEQLFDGQVPQPGSTLVPSPTPPPPPAAAPTDSAASLPPLNSPSVPVPTSTTPWVPDPVPARLPAPPETTSGLLPPPQSRAPAKPSPDRQVVQAHLEAAEPAATVKIQKSANGTQEPPAAVRLGKQSSTKTSWFRRN